MGTRDLVVLPVFLHLLLLCFNGNGSVIKMKNTSNPSSTLDPSWVTQLTRIPRAFLYSGFLSNEECDHLTKLPKGKLEVSMVADVVTGKAVKSQFRTSTGMFLSKAQDEIVADIEDRIAAWTFLPPENGEAMQILRYEHGQKYEPHHDYFEDEVNKLQGGHRAATVLMYLSDVENGGETVFPYAEAEANYGSKDGNLSNCARDGYAVKPMKGDALLFFSLHPNATTDWRSLHGSCPVLAGEKWSATKWIHVRSYDNIPKIVRGRTSRCDDQDAKCPIWAKSGECEKNPRYMIGNERLPGSCRKSCNVC